MSYTLWAKYEVVLHDGPDDAEISTNYIMFQRSDNFFTFRKSSEIDYNPVDIDFDFRPSDWQYWTDDAKKHIASALAGNLWPIYVNKPRVISDSEISISSEPIKCVCPDDNYSFAYGFIGCTCGATKKGKG